MGPNPNGPLSVSCDRAIRYPGFGVPSGTLLLEISGKMWMSMLVVGGVSVFGEFPDGNLFGAKVFKMGWYDDYPKNKNLMPWEIEIPILFVCIVCDMTILQMICIVKEFGVGRPMPLSGYLFSGSNLEKKMIFEAQAPFRIMFKNPHPTETFIHNILRVNLFWRGPAGHFHPRTFRSVFFDTNCEWDTLNKGILGHWKDVNKIFRSAQQPKTRKIRNMCSCSTKHQRQERSTS